VEDASTAHTGRKSEPEVYRDAAGEWQWRLRDPDGLVIADSPEGYETRVGAEQDVLARVAADQNRRRRRWALTVVVVTCAGVFLPFGDATGGRNLLLAPLAAGVITAVVARYARLGPWPAQIRLGCLAAALTLATMLAVIFFILVFWGV
jgi:uncharacterized protein YegP (UPF0339 family)